MPPTDKEMLMLMTKEELVVMILGMRRIQASSYKQLLEKYKNAETNYKFHAKEFGGKKLIKGYMQGVMEGMVQVNPNLKSTVMEGPSNIDDDNL